MDQGDDSHRPRLDAVEQPVAPDEQLAQLPAADTDDMRTTLGEQIEAGRGCFHLGQERTGRIQGSFGDKVLERGE
jgi:hypothetical protein